MPMMKKIRQATRKIKNRNLAIPAAATAIPVNPNTAATNAITRKITAQLGSRRSRCYPESFANAWRKVKSGAAISDTSRER